MAQVDLLRFLLLAAIWGSSYMFMRIAAPGFGPLPLVMLRLQAGFCAILGATVPMFAVAIDALWWRHALQAGRLFGLALGFAGVTVLAWDHFDFSAGGTGWAVLATLGASACYGCAAHYGKHRFAGQPVMLPAAGSMLAAAILLLPAGLATWPAQAVPPLDWFAVAVLAVVCTACAYLLYYKLIARISATALTGVTFVIPVFGVLWGALYPARGDHAAHRRGHGRDPARHGIHHRHPRRAARLAGRIQRAGTMCHLMLRSL